MKTRNKPAIKRNSPQSSADDFTPEQIAEWREGVARRRLAFAEIEPFPAAMPSLSTVPKTRTCPET